MSKPRCKCIILHLKMNESLARTVNWDARVTKDKFADTSISKEVGSVWFPQGRSSALSITLRTAKN
jgi:hypothetical protein